MQIINDNDVYTDIVRMLDDYCRDTDPAEYLDLLADLLEEIEMRLVLSGIKSGGNGIGN